MQEATSVLVNYPNYEFVLPPTYYELFILVAYQK